jgi:molecular chaperone GrpE
MKLIEVIDHLEMAIAHAKESNELEALIKGVDMTLKQLREMLEKEGVTQINAYGEGVEFDPFKHEVVSQEIDESYPENTVIDVIRKGYVFRDRVIRPAMVKIAVKEK